MPDTTVQEKNLRRAVARLEYAQQQVQRCKSWLVRLPKMVEETYTSKGHRLQNFAEAELTRALATLARQIVSLELYTGISTDYSSQPRSLPPGPREADA